MCITAIGDDGRRYGPVSLPLSASAAAHFNSRDLENGNASKGLPGGVGDGSGNWRLELTTDPTDLKMEALAYIRTTEGFVTSMHEVAAETQGGSNRYHVPFFNPGRNASATGGRAGPGGPIASVSNRRGGDRKG